jgi:outer membrane lipoprotein SlyB
MNAMNKILCALLMLGAVSLTGCVRSMAGDTYTREEVQRPMGFREATVEAVRIVKMEGTRGPVGVGAGAAVGGVAGSGVGQGKGQVVGAVVGAVVGGIVGAAAEEAYTRTDAWELTLKYDNGERVVIVQEVGNDKFAAGERVKVLSGARTRVTK